MIVFNEGAELRRAEAGLPPLYAYALQRQFAEYVLDPMMRQLIERMQENGQLPRTPKELTS